MKRKTYIILSGLIIFWIMAPLDALRSQPSERIRSSNRHYRRGDWVTYSMTRFIRSLAIGPEEIYFATTGGITRFNHFSDRWQEPYTVSDGLASNDIDLVAFDAATGYLWCTTALSISYMEPASRWWYNFYHDEIQLEQGEKIESMGFDDQSKIYLITNKSRCLVSPSTMVIFNEGAIPQPSIPILWFGKKAAAGSLPPFMNTPYGLIYDSQKKVFMDNHLRNFRITCWARDHWNRLWIGTWGLGAGRVDLFNMNLELLPFGLWGPTVHTILADEKGFWLGGIQKEQKTSAITLWNWLTSAPKYYEPFIIFGFNDDRITQIEKEGTTLWVATQNGLVRYDRKKESWRTYDQTSHLVDNRLEDLLFDGQTLWIATRGGLSAVQRTRAGKKDSLSFQIIDYEKLANVWIYDIANHDTLLWAATEFGLYVYDKARKSGGFYRGAFGPGTQRTFAVTCYEDEVWYATEKGISAFVVDEDSMKNWPTYAARNLQTDSRIYRLYADGYAVWAATQQGVYKLDRRDNRWVHYTIADGLPAADIYCLLPDGDYIWFGSSAGLTRFFWNDPHRID